GGLLSVALSLGSPLPDVIRRRVSVEPGLSSTRSAHFNREGHNARTSSSGHPASWHKRIGLFPARTSTPALKYFWDRSCSARDNERVTIPRGYFALAKQKYALLCRGLLFGEKSR